MILYRLIKLPTYAPELTFHFTNIEVQTPTNDRNKHSSASHLQFRINLQSPTSTMYYTIMNVIHPASLYLVEMSTSSLTS